MEMIQENAFNHRSLSHKNSRIKNLGESTVIFLSEMKGIQIQVVIHIEILAEVLGLLGLLIFICFFQ